MLASEREDMLYREGKRCAIADEETNMMAMLGETSEQKSLLDLGCGTGEISVALQEMGYKTKGLDFSSEAIKIGKSNGLDCDLADLDQGIPEEDSSYDVVWAGDVIEHVFDPILVLSEASRVLKSDGKFYATIPYDINYKARLKTAFGVSYQESVYRQFKQFKHHTFFSERLMRYMYECAKLEITDLTYVINLTTLLPSFGNDQDRLYKKKFTKSKLLRMFSYLMIVEAKKI